MKTNKEKFLELVSEYDPGTMERNKWRIRNRWWLRIKKRMYSEEEVIELLRKSHFVEQNIDEWFEQFKKK